MDEQMTLAEYRATQTITKDGNLRPAPFFAHRERCELCNYWTLDTIQPPDGWGIKGFCGVHQGARVDSLDYCAEYKEG